MTFWEWLLGPAPPRPKPAPRSSSKPAGGKSISRSELNSMIYARAALLAGGAHAINTMHLVLAEQQVKGELAQKKIAIMGLQSKGISEAANEAGGADKI